MTQRSATLAVLLSVLALAGPALAEGPPYGWTISASDSDPFLNAVPFVSGLNTAYLWFVCSAPAPTGPGGMAAAEFDLCPDNAANVVLSFTPANGYLNAGGAANLLLAVGGCPTAPVMAGTILTLENTPGQLCICTSAANGIKGTVDCSAAPQLWPMGWVGLDRGSGQDPCGKENVTCVKPVSVEQQTWGTIKSLYR